MKFTAIFAMMCGASAIDTEKATALHEQMGSFVSLIDAVSTHDQDTIYQTIS